MPGVRPVYEQYLNALVEIADCQKRYDLASRKYKKLRDEIDRLYDQLLPHEQDDVLRFSLTLDLEGQDESSTDACAGRGAVASDARNEATASEDRGGEES